MLQREVVVIIVLLSLSLIGALLLDNFTGQVIQETDQFAHIETLHWTHMPLTYSVQETCDKTKISDALSMIESSTNLSVSFQQVQSNVDITITCQTLNNCYEKTQVRRWFWIITTEAVCEHEAGIAKIAKIRGNKILKAEINLIDLEEKQTICIDTELHELLHIFDYQHSQNPESIMYPEASSVCKKAIDKEITDDLIKKYSR